MYTKKKYIDYDQDSPLTLFHYFSHVKILTVRLCVLLCHKSRFNYFIFFLNSEREVVVVESSSLLCV